MPGHIETGKSGEQIAAEHLEAKGYRILDRNWRCGREEIDIIARKENLIVVVEVKTRTGNAAIEPAEVVPPSKVRILVRTANAYMRYKNQEGEVRFDIITILIKPDGHKLEHIEDAFYATL